MGQDLVDLAVALDHESPVGGLEAIDTFKFPSLLDSTPSDDESKFNIFSAFSMVVVGVTTLEVQPISTDQVVSSNTSPCTVSEGVTPPMDNEWVFIPSNLSSFSSDLEASTPREGGGLSGDEQVLKDDEWRDEEMEIDSSEGEEDLTTTPTHVTSTLEVEVILIVVTLEVEPVAPLVVPNLHTLGRVYARGNSIEMDEVEGPSSMSTPSPLDEAMVEMSCCLKDFLTSV